MARPDSVLSFDLFFLMGLSNTKSERESVDNLQLGTNTSTVSIDSQKLLSSESSDFFQVHYLIQMDSYGDSIEMKQNNLCTRKKSFLAWSANSEGNNWDLGISIMGLD